MRAELHLLRKVARLPHGEKVPVGRLARELFATQTVVLDMLQWLVDQGKLEAQTLRPPPSPKVAKLQREIAAHQPVNRVPQKAEKTHETFEEQLAKVARGEAKVVDVVRVPKRGDPQGTLGGVATGML